MAHGPRGTYKPGSDIDLTLYGNEISLEQKNRILDELDELDLPYSIDLSVFSQLNHVQLRDHIERVGVVFYARHLDSCVGCHTT
jgi:Nucleotidyltransferase domain.